MTTIQRTNCVTNPRAAFDTKGWKSYNDYVVRVEAAPVALPAGTTTAFAVPGYSTGLPAISDRFDLPADCVAGTDYLYASCFAYVIGVEPHEVSFWASLKFYDDTGNEISWMAFAHDEIAPLTKFELFQGLIKVPEDAVKFHVFIKTDEVIQGPGYAPNESLKPDLYFTQVQVENAYGRARLPFLYADGDTDGWHWEGTAHDSVSMCDTTESVSIVEPTETVVAIPSDAWLTLPPMTEDTFLGVTYGDEWCSYLAYPLSGEVLFTPGYEAVTYGEAFEGSWEAGEGYQIDDVLLDGESIGACTSKSWGAYNEDHEIGVESSGVETTVQYLVVSGGTLTGTTTQSLVYGSGPGTVVEAVPDEGYEFLSWSDGRLTPQRTDEDVLVNTDLTATFQLIAADVVTLTYSAGAGGSLTGTLVQEVTIGQSGTAVEVVADEGYAFVSWDDDSTDAYRVDAAVTEDITVEAQFAALTMRTVTYVAGAHGALEGTLVQSVVDGGTTEVVKAVPDTDYRFANWDDLVKLASRVDRNVTADATHEALFLYSPPEPASYSLEYSAGANGSLSGVASQDVAPGKNGTRVMAVPDAGYQFAGWSDDYPVPSRIATNVHANLTVEASFSNDTHRLRYLTCRHATLDGSATQNVVDGGDGTEVEVHAISGYRFVKWSDGVLTAARTDTDVHGSKYLFARVKKGELH